ncbi:MAG: alpha-amylase [Chloroflexi bacterium]|nr:alpha-amylase [Chloroflexota bacterium]
MRLHLAPVYEFHVSRLARDRYQFDDSLFALSGNVVFANFHAARQFAQQINQKRDLISFPEQAVQAGQINALGLLDEILHMAVAAYRQERNPQVMAKALAWLNERVGSEHVEAALRKFTEDFPPVAVYRRQASVAETLDGETGGTPHREVALEELLMLWVTNANPACASYGELFDDSELAKFTAYKPIIESLSAFFDTQPGAGAERVNLVQMLRAPALASPHSLTGQLDFLRTRWSALLGGAIFRLLSSQDLIREEEKVYFVGAAGGGPGPGPALVYEFGGLEAEPERFTPDRDWMPSLVLLAKNSYVWLDQLTKKYQRAITRLDQVPEEELAFLGRAGFTGLWLIGLWQRSPASQRIKQMRGNPEAVASAYSLFSYDIADDLGGDQAYHGLREMAARHGIRLASDMVPNHMGIDSRWVIEHPDWFVSLPYSPFPSYSFNGADLSWDGRVRIFLEDHYYDSSDAAVVFKRVDAWTGEEKYLYHGNDGTSFPWNDTAQLNYLMPEVREAVIQTILHVARKFPVIRFDAAMTLAKRHYQRLWYPEPGGGGDIPSRAEHGLTKAQFDAAMPEEFWREVVDRLAKEAPDTLLLAEAFWLMEGYFVRTLGMHRVYNSAFMNMLRDEKNQEYRQVIKNTIEFDPEILKRYVSFMNNPDERTAAEQFGKGDKYFGVCTLLATLPGLPMFGHGQLEGFTEKYGMEYRRAYQDESADGYLMERHEREIFPLLRKRYLFAEARDFLLYDFYTPEGYINEDVYAYSNQAGEERALVVYHNKYARAQGWIRISAAFPVKTGEGDDRVLVQQSLGEGLRLENDAGLFTIFRDHVSGLEYIRSNQELHQHGLFIALESYQYHVFMDFRQVRDDADGRYRQLAAFLNGRGTPSIEVAMKEVFLQGVHAPLREALRWLLTELAENGGSEEELAAFTLAAQEKVLPLLQGAREASGGDSDLEALAEQTAVDAAALLALISTGLVNEEAVSEAERLAYLLDGPDETHSLGQRDPALLGALAAWSLLRRLGAVTGEVGAGDISRAWLDEWLLGKATAHVLQERGLGEGAAWRCVGLVKLLLGSQGWFDPGLTAEEQAPAALKAWLGDNEAQKFLGVNRYQGVLWYNKEAFEEWLWWMAAIAALDVPAKGAPAAEAPEVPAAEMDGMMAVIRRLQKATDASQFQVEKLRDAAQSA